VFDQFAQLVRTHYPHLEVVGENYPPPPTKALIARILSMVKMALLVCLLFGQNPFVLLNIPTPAVYSWALENKMYACLMVFFLSNSIELYFKFIVYVTKTLNGNIRRIKMTNESYVCVHKSLYITKKKEKQTNDSQLKEYTKEKYLL